MSSQLSYKGSDEEDGEEWGNAACADIPNGARIVGSMAERILEMMMDEFCCVARMLVIMESLSSDVTVKNCFRLERYTNEEIREKMEEIRGREKNKKGTYAA